MSGRIENVRKYFGEIKRMSTSELMQLTHDLELKEKKTLAMLIAHISEISFRKAHLDRAQMGRQGNSAEFPSASN